ncbi:DUF1080 domain-containing protein [Luteolibacter arcticus]|uniref:DUF1080 domain-containing protein n=1 Tax=Luteolibacter arcticus TaxID=1581411 RepID=A0ABT3GKG1_9BACT|nr:DUF1080 domain-containing protein [Luteolibacter arcticus]MCW1924008.1 DUF1080 domain-containing protein [Luteolibacter arcticus]
MLRQLLLSAFIAGAASAKEAAWTSLFDGKSLSGWVAAKGGKPGDGWKVEDGCIHRAGKGGDILSEKEYKDFEFEFEWKISAKGNSGVKYRVQKSPAGWLGPEYQVLDDAGHPNGKVADTTAGSLYEIAPAAKDKDLKPAGEWNVSKIVAKGTVLEHWLNGKLAVKIDTAGKEWPELKKASKFAKFDDFAGPAAGKLLLQDHDDEVWFRNLRIREL